MPVVVKAADDQMMFYEEGEFFLQHWVLLALGKRLGLVSIVKEGWLVSDDQVLAVFNIALQDGVGRHHGHGNAGDGSLRVARFESVPSFREPSDAYMRLNAVDYVLRGERTVVRGAGLRILRGTGRRRNREREKYTSKFQHAP